MVLAPVAGLEVVVWFVAGWDAAVSVVGGVGGGRDDDRGTELEGDDGARSGEIEAVGGRVLSELPLARFWMGTLLLLQPGISKYCAAMRPAAGLTGIF